MEDLFEEVTIKLRPHEGKARQGGKSIPGRTASTSVLNAEGALCILETERSMRLVHICGHQYPLSHSCDTVMGHLPWAARPYYVSQSALKLHMAMGLGSRWWTLINGLGWELVPIRGVYTVSPPHVLFVSSWLHPGLGSNPAWTGRPQGIEKPQLGSF